MWSYDGRGEDGEVSGALGRVCVRTVVQLHEHVRELVLLLQRGGEAGLVCMRVERERLHEVDRGHLP